MEAGGTIIATAGVIVTMQASRFAWLKAAIPGLANRVDGVDRGVAVVRGRLSLALPALSGHSGANPCP